MKENITEKQIIEFLEQKRIGLIEELHKTETALRALGIEGLPSPYTSDYISHSSRLKIKPNLLPLNKIINYTPDLKLDEKIAFALTNLKYGTKKEIIDFLIKTDPKIEPKKLDNNIAVRLSSLLKENLIDGNKKGRTYSYHLIR